MKDIFTIQYDEIEWLYRDKPMSYMNNILHTKGGLMEVYLKDNNGDQASIINGQISGLFFATFLRGMSPPATSVFGPSRLLLSAKKVLGHPLARLYFADFYCIHVRHHATVVLTHRGTSTDDFCARNLIELDLRTNDFLRYDPVTEVVTVSFRKLYVEVLYTNNIDIHEWEREGNAYRTTVGIAGRGTSTVGGLPKRTGCPVCNL